jgi:hypothetical protein
MRRQAEAGELRQSAFAFVQSRRRATLADVMSDLFEDGVIVKSGDAAALLKDLEELERLRRVEGSDPPGREPEAERR